jgi:hypothetical protein
LLAKDETIAFPKSKWREAIEKHAKFAAPALDGNHLCIQTTGGFVDVWQMNDDKRIGHETVAGVSTLRAAAGGCLVYATERKDGAMFIAWGGSGRWLPTGGKPVSAIGHSPDELFVAAGREIYRFDATGQPRDVVKIDVGVTAIARVNDTTLAVGYRDGSLELTTSAGAASSSRDVFEFTPSSPVTVLKTGPRGTLIAGFANGTVGMWTWANGQSIIQSSVHGQLTHLLLDGEHLYGASDLGAHFKWDLRPFFVDSCSLLRDMWSATPIIWQAGQAIAAKPPSGHRCLQ